MCCPGACVLSPTGLQQPENTVLAATTTGTTKTATETLPSLSVKAKASPVLTHGTLAQGAEFQVTVHSRGYLSVPQGTEAASHHLANSSASPQFTDIDQKAEPLYCTLI